MGRSIYFYEPLWLDRDYKKAFGKLTPSEQDERQQELAALITALSNCRHPASDPGLKPWRPASFTMGKIAHLFEYRCRYPLRVIARCCIPDGPEAPVLMVCATLAHDFDRIREIVRRHRGELNSWP
jgi:hypothetical protein